MNLLPDVAYEASLARKRIRKKVLSDGDVAQVYVNARYKFRMTHFIQLLTNLKFRCAEEVRYTMKYKRDYLF